ncbi:MAG: hypothetical protein QCH96_02965, partial [Candidatus Thermoplasmatota archaeon]|nr:hypothetical protein [Candidatus Thermoplasmatota archaeon]
SLADDQNDIGYSVDAGNEIRRAITVYVGEPVDERIPGRGRTGSLDPNGADKEDWYRFTVCEGQTIGVSIATSQDYSCEIIGKNGDPFGTSHTAMETGYHYVRIFANPGASSGEYTMSITISSQNDAGTGADAGNSITTATPIIPGSYTGYLDHIDHEDWYSFNVDAGQGIFVTVKPIEKSDYDIHLYNPSGEHVHSSQYYGIDTLEYPADVSGTWKIKIDIFPGWDESKWPDNYLLYGSGVYELDLSMGGTATAPPTLPPPPSVTPVAQTFIVTDDPTSNKDEYCYLAAVPAANYVNNGQRHISPVVYQGVDIIPNWFTTVDQTTQYLLDDWNTYLARHDMTADVFEVANDPIKAAAEIATAKWESADTAVLAIDGSIYVDEARTILDKDASLTTTKEITTFKAEDMQEFIPGYFSAPMFIGSKWAAINVIAEGEEFAGDTMILTPRYESRMADWWPHDSSIPGGDKDTFFPITQSGIWVPQIDSISGLDQLKIIKYSGDRHSLDIDDTDSSLTVTINTQQESRLIIYLIDPDGNIRRPTLPSWNGGQIKPIHQWHGGHWEHDEDEYRHYIVGPHTAFSVEVHNPMKGTWTAIVVPYLDMNTWEASFSGSYHITATLREHNDKRISAGLSASNAAVLASLNHAPLLYVSEDSIPAETTSAITELGVTKIIFVNINDVSTASPPGSVTTYTSLNQVVDAIKQHGSSDNVITITSFATGEGYFAPAGMIAAYHGSPVLNMGEAKASYNALDMYQTWKEYDGDYYHGTRSLGKLPMMNKPSEISNPPSLFDLILYYFKNERTLPPVGLDLRLQWMSIIHDDIYAMINSYGLDRDGQEAYIFVSPRDTDIRDTVNRAMNGNNSYAGQIPVKTPAFSSAIICRSILYPAIIYANPGKDVTTSQMMNYFTGQYAHSANDGNKYYTYAPRDNKNSLSSHGRFYEGHCMWENLLERYNTGALICIYSGHGTGGSGISSQYKNMAEQFPLGTTTHDHLHDFEWWDSWAGYAGFDDKMTKTVRDQAISIYNAEEPSLYDIIHFKWVDQLFENLHSEIDIWSSCTTQAHFGPIVYLSHGTVLSAGCTGSGYTLVDDLYKTWILRDFLVKGYTIGESVSLNNWIVNRDYTTKDPTTIYGTGTFFAAGISSANVIFGDPTLRCYNPTWIEPIPIAP